jgi:hypothetical protein
MGRLVLDYEPGISQTEMFDIAHRFSTEDLIEREIAAGQVFGPVHQRWQIEKAPEHVLRMLERGRRFPELVAARQGFVSPGAAKASPGSFTAINTTTTEWCLWSSGVAAAQQTTYAPIPAGDMYAGKKYRVAFGGTIAVTATPSCIWTPRVGPNVTPSNAANLSFGASPTVTCVASLNHPFYGEFSFTVRSLGATAALVTAAGSGYVMYGNASATATVAVMGGTIPTTVDDTVLTGILVSLTWGTNSASNTATCTWMDFSDGN